MTKRQYETACDEHADSDDDVRSLSQGRNTPSEGESQEPDHPVKVQNIHATIQHALGIDPEKEIITPIGRPITLSDGVPVLELMKAS